MPQSDGETEAQGDQRLAESHSGVRKGACLSVSVTSVSPCPATLFMERAPGRSEASGFTSLSLSLRLWRTELVVVTSQGHSEAPSPKPSGKVPGERELSLL